MKTDCSPETVVKRQPGSFPNMSNFGYEEIRMLGSPRPPVYEAFSSAEVPSADDQKITETFPRFSAKPRLLSRRGTVPSTPPISHVSEEIRKLESTGKKLIVRDEEQPIGRYSIPERNQSARNEATLPVLCGAVKQMVSPRSASRSSLSCVPVGEDISKVSGLAGKLPLSRSNSHSVNSSRSMPRMKPVLTRSVTCPSNIESKIDERSEWVSLPLTNCSHTNEKRSQSASAGSFTLPQMKPTERLGTTEKSEEDLETLNVSNSTDIKRASHARQTALPSRLRRFNWTCPHEFGCMKALTLDGTAFPIHRKIAEECRIHAEAMNTHVKRAMQ